jgi:hypothetical protein
MAVPAKAGGDDFLPQSRKAFRFRPATVRRYFFDDRLRRLFRDYVLSIMPETTHYIGKLLIVLGAVVVVIGVLFMLSDKIPWLGKLPGDILVRRKNFTFYFPLATCILISIVLTVLFWLFGRK